MAYIWAVHKGRWEGSRGVFDDYGSFLSAIRGGGAVWRKFYAYDRRQARYFARHGRIKVKTLDYIFEPCQKECKLHSDWCA